jgi:hypothetical protein
MNKMQRKAILAWLEDAIERHPSPDLLQLTVGVIGNGGTAVWWPNDPKQRQETQTRLWCSDSLYVNL